MTALNKAPEPISFYNSPSAAKGPVLKAEPIDDKPLEEVFGTKQLNPQEPRGRLSLLSKLLLYSLLFLVVVSESTLFSSSS